MNAKKIIFLLMVILSMTTNSYAENFYDKNEVSVIGGVGYHKLLYNVSSGSTDDKVGGTIGLGYLHLFSEHWGIQTGIEAAFFNSKLSLSNITTVTKGLNDGEGHNFDFYSTLQSYQEIQKMWLLSIPIMMAYQTGDYHKFYLLAGAKVGLPIGDYQSTGTYVNRGYFPEKDNWAVDQRFMGFGRFTDVKSQGQVNYNVSVQLALEAGIKWYTGSNWSIYSGVYGEYGLTNIVNQKNKSNFISYKSFLSEGSSPTGSVFHSTYQNESDQTVVFTEKVHPLSVGLRVRISFGW